jgi:hypothetical protein
MPLPVKRLDRDRVDFSSHITEKEVEQLVSDPDIRTLQCSSPVEPYTWDLLNQKLFSQRPEIELRVYGFYSAVCDLSFVSRVGNVRRFAADCLRQATGVEHVADLKHLEELSIGIYSLESFDFLKQLPNGIKSLSLAATKSKKPQLQSLSRFQSLTRLYLERQQQGIEVLSELKRLEDLTLRSITTEGLDYISTLPRLWSLDIKLGGIRNLSAIGGKESIKYLELWQIRGLSDIGVISSLGGLQSLFLQSLINVTAIPDLSKLCNLRRLHLENLKSLRDVSTIRYAPALEEFLHISAQSVQPEMYKDLMSMPSLKYVHVGYGSRKKNEEFNALVLWSGKQTGTSPENSRIQKHGRPRYGTNLLSRQDLKPKTRPSLDRTYHNRVSPFSRYF